MAGGGGNIQGASFYAVFMNCLSVDGKQPRLLGMEHKLATSTEPRVSTPVSRIAYIDCLRALAIVGVVAHHTTQLFPDMPWRASRVAGCKPGCIYFLSQVY